jgi:DNA replication protein DnaC
MVVPAAERFRQRQVLSAACRRLALSQLAVTLCEQEATPKQEAFLVRVFEAELAHRETIRRTRLLARAGFPVAKTLEDYDRHRVTLPSTLTWADLDAGTFIDARRNLVLYGAVGTGKTHLGIALGIRACEQGRTVRFFTVTDLVLRLSEARRAGTVDRLLQDIQRTELLILDEWGYVPVDKEGSQLLFRIIADSYETRSLILTTNLEFSKWGGIFTDDQMAAAMIDRLAHHGHLLLFEGESYRMTHALMKER